MTTPHSHQEARLQELQREAVRKAEHEAEAARYRGVSMSGMGPGPYRAPSEAELDERARKAVEGRAQPHAALKRRLIALAEAGDRDAARALAACDRGDDGCWDQAAALAHQIEAMRAA